MAVEKIAAEIKGGKTEVYDADLGEEIEGPKTIMLENVPLFRLPRYERLR